MPPFSLAWHELVTSLNHWISTSSILLFYFTEVWGMCTRVVKRLLSCIVRRYWKGEETDWVWRMESYLRFSTTRCTYVMDGRSQQAITAVRLLRYFRNSVNRYWCFPFCWMKWKYSIEKLSRRTMEILFFYWVSGDIFSIRSKARIIGRAHISNDE